MDPRHRNFALETCPVAHPLILNRADMRGKQLLRVIEN
jgi:hypothetical protein